VISGLESLDAAAAADVVYDAGDELSSSSVETDAADASSVTVEFHCYHSFPAAKWSDNVQVGNSHMHTCIHKSTYLRMR